MAARHLAGVILFSSNPERLAEFYREVLGLPFEAQRHGRIQEHLECEFGNIHFAILTKRQVSYGDAIVLSFAVSDIQAFLEGLRQRGIEPLHPILDIGEGKRLSSISDPDGNTIRLIQVD